MNNSGNNNNMGMNMNNNGASGNNNNMGMNMNTNGAVANNPMNRRGRFMNFNEIFFKQMSFFKIPPMQRVMDSMGFNKNMNNGGMIWNQFVSPQQMFNNHIIFVPVSRNNNNGNGNMQM